MASFIRCCFHLVVIGQLINPLVTSFGGSGNDYAVDCAIDETTAEVYIAGFTYSTILGLPGNTSDIFVRKFKPNMTQIWAFTFVSIGIDRLERIVLGEISRDIFVLGKVFGSTGRFNSSAGAPHRFMIRLNKENGSIIWLQNFETPANGENIDVNVRPNFVQVEQYSYICGYNSILSTENGSVLESNTEPFDQRSGNLLITTYYWTVGYYAKIYRLNSTGHRNHLTTIGSLQVNIRTPKLDPVTGNFYNLGHNTQTTEVSTTYGGTDIMILCMNSSAGYTERWRKAFGTIANEYLMHLHIEPKSSQLYAFGFSGNKPFYVSIHPNGTQLEAYTFAMNTSGLPTMSMYGQQISGILNAMYVFNGFAILVGSATGKFPGQQNFGGTDAFYVQATVEGFLVSSVSPEVVRANDKIIISLQSVFYSSEMPIVSISGRNCSNLMWEDPNQSSVLSCNVPAAVGRFIKLEFNFVAQQRYFYTYISYYGPVLKQMNATDGPGSGGTPVLFTVDNLGLAGNDTIKITIGGFSCQQISQIAADRVSCLTPPGRGPSIQPVILEVGGQSTATWNFTYNPPIVSSIVTPAGGFDVLGGEILKIYGSNFGFACSNALGNCNYLTSVTVGPYDCDNVAIVSDGEIQCSTSPGIGGNLSVVVTINGFNNPYNSMFSYKRPRITGVTPPASDGTGAKLVISGQQFGPSASEIFIWMIHNITLERMNCSSALWQTNLRVECSITEAHVVGFYSLFIKIGNQMNSASDNIQHQMGYNLYSPQSTNLSSNLLENGNKTIRLQCVDADPGDTLTAIITSLPLNGKLFDFLSAAPGNLGFEVGTSSDILDPQLRVIYMPNQYYNGNDSFTFKCKDALGRLSNASSVSISIQSVNQPPSVAQKALVSNLQSTDNFAEIFLPVDDVDETDRIVFRMINMPSRGRWYLSGRSVAIQEALTANFSYSQLLPSSAKGIKLLIQHDEKGGGSPYTIFEYYFEDSLGSKSEQNGTVMVQITCTGNEVNNIWSEGALCKVCPSGAVCSIAGEYLPINQYGYFPLSISEFIPCIPEEACPAGTVPNTTAIVLNLHSTFSCLQGYKGLRCGVCEVGYYRKAGLCEECPQISIRPTMLILAAIGLVIVALILVNLLKKIDIGFLGILIAYMQTISIFQMFKLRWPNQVMLIYHWMSVIYLNIELTSPECFIADQTNSIYELKWFLTIGLPVFTLAVVLMLLLIYFIISFLLNIFRSNKPLNALEKQKITESCTIVKSSSFRGRQADDLEREKRKDNYVSPFAEIRKIDPQIKYANQVVNETYDASLTFLGANSNVMGKVSETMTENDIDGEDKDEKPRSRKIDAENVIVTLSRSSLPKNKSYSRLDDPKTPNLEEGYSSEKNKNLRKKTVTMPSMLSILTGDYDDAQPVDANEQQNLEDMGGGKPSFPVTLIGTFILLLKMIYIAVARRTLELFDCTFNESSGNYYFDIEPDRKCFDPWWQALFPYAIVSIVLFILGIPALFLNLFFMRRRYLAIPVENRTKFHNFILRITYKKKSEYRAESSYWDALTLIQKLAIVVCQLLFTQSLPFQVVVMIMILVIFLSAHARIYPFSMRSLNHLEFMSIMSSIIVLLCGLLFYMQEFKSEREITIFGYVVLAIIAGTAGMIIVTLVWHLMAMWRQFRRRQKGD